MSDFDHRTFLKHLTTRPGVYQMRDIAGRILYVGKAKNLKSRVSSYFRGQGLSTKTLAMVQRIAEIGITVCRNEVEALILEQTLIKSERPPYNILLRDDKSYPYVFMNTAHPFPGLYYRRGQRQPNGKTFGPFPSAGAVKSTLNLIQKTFQIRQCEDSIYANRSRPCLQYQIGRCSGPCVGLISQSQYAEDLDHVKLFLEGRSQDLFRLLEDKMDAAASSLEFEQASRYRDVIARLRRVLSEQVMESDLSDLDALAVVCDAGLACIALVSVRGGRVIGVSAHFPERGLLESNAELLEAFIAQYYLGSERPIPSEVLLAETISDLSLVGAALSEAARRHVRVTDAVRGIRAQYLDLARTNAVESLSARLASRDGQAKRITDFAARFGIEPPGRFECFDISHTQGEATVASCVVFDAEGPVKRDYRIFNIEGITAGDDYAAMRQALQRRYQRIRAGEEQTPDVLIIDGGLGQLREASKILATLGVQNIFLLGVAKGVTRKAGFEILHRADTGEEYRLDPTAPALHLIQHIRDEAHRFAITKHRQARGKTRNTSPLEGIPGIGPKRRQALLRHFGGLQLLSSASVSEIAKVQGMSQSTAELVYSALHRE